MTLTTCSPFGKGQEAMCLLPSGLPSLARRGPAHAWLCRLPALTNIALNTPLILMPQFNVVNKGEFNVILG